jgi:aspartyl-tRNA(Asn)/glutamyl-tRNA(Gln) amidotransferase subunit A
VRINLRCLRNTFIGNFLDACAITLPVNPLGEPPVALMIMDPHGHDRQLFAAAGAVEAVLAGGRG